MSHFEYGEKEIEYLKKKDKRLKELIEKYGFIEREIHTDIFISLIHSIVSQQISGKAAQTVWERMLSDLKEITPASLYNTSIENLQAHGISYRKAGYIKNIAEKVYTKELDLDSLTSKTDEEVIKELTTLNGVGVWTAEMLMIFSMNRKNILSYGDYGIKKGLCLLYHHKEMNKTLFKKYQNRYSPYASIASFYLWKLANKKGV